MADLKLVGAVAIKVRPNVKGFKGDTQRQIKQQLKDVEAEVKVKIRADADTGEAEADLEKLGEKVEKKTLSLRVRLDHDSVRAAEKQFEKMLEPFEDIKFSLDDDGSIEEAKQRFEELKRNAKVTIEYHEDEKGYQSALAKIAAVKREKLEAKISIGTSDEELNEWEELFRAQLAEAAHVDITYGSDRPSIQKAINTIEAEMAKLQQTTIPVGLNQEELEAKKKELEEALAGTPVELSVNYDDQDSLKAAKKRLLSMLSELKSEPLPVLLNEEDIQKQIDRINELIKEELEEPTVEIKPQLVEVSFSNDRASMKRAIEQLDKELEKFRTLKVAAKTDPESIKALRDDIQKRMDKTPIKLKYEKNAEGYQAVLKEIEDEIHRLKFKPVEVDLALDADGLRKQALEFRQKLHELGRIDGSLNVELNRQSANKVKEDTENLRRDLSGKNIEMGVNLAGTELAAARLAFLGRDRFVTFYANVNERSLAVAEGAIKSLGGLNVLGDFTSMLERMFTNFDQMAAKASNIAVTLGNIINLLTTATAGMVSVGEGVSKSLGLLAAAPAFLGAATVGYTIFTAAFNNFFDAFNKDPKIAKAALEALPPLARKTVDSITGLYKGLANPIQERFWEKVGTTLSDAIEHLYPNLKERLLESTDAVGEFVAGFGRSMTKLSLNGDLDKMFEGFKGFFVNLSGASEPFFDAWNKFGLAGSALLPQFGTWITNLAIQFDQWATKLGKAGIEKMIMDGVYALQAMWRVGEDTINIFGAIAKAAQAAGIGGLGEFEQGLRRIADKMNGEPWQSRAALIFEGARKGTEGLMDGFRDLGRAIGDSADEVGYILELLGLIGGAAITNMGSLIDDQSFQTGITRGLEGMLEMMRELNPAAKSLGDIIGNLSTIAGSVFSTMGPTVSRFFATVEQVMDKLVNNLSQVAPRLSNTVGAIFAAVTPAVLLMADVLNNILTIINKVPESFVLAGVAAAAFFALRGLASKFFESLSGTARFKELEQNWVNSQIAAGKYVTSLQLVDGEMRKVTTLNNQFNPTKAVFNDLTNSVGGTVTGIRDMYRVASSAETGLSPLNAAWKTATTVGGNFAKTVGTGLLGALGGPWGLAISAAAIGIGAFAQGQADAAAKAEALTATLDKQTGAITAATNAMIADNIMKDANNGFYLFETGAKSASETIEALGLKVKDTSDIVAAGGKPYDDMIALLEEGKTALDQAGVSFDENGFMIEGNSEKLDAWAKKMKISKDAIKSMDLLGLITLLQNERAAVEGSQSAHDIRNASLSTADKRVQDFNTAMRTYNDQTLTADQRTRALKDALDLLSGKELSLGDAEQKVNDSLRNMGGSMQAFSENGVTVMKKVGGAFRDAQGNVKDFNGVIDSVSGKISTVSEAGSTLDTMLQTTTDATLATVTKMKDAGKGLPEITKYLEDQRTAFINLGVEAGLDAGLVAKAYDYMIGANPKDLITTITAQGIEDAQTRIRDYKGTLDEINAYQAVAKIAGDDAILGEKLANSYTSLSEWDAAVGTATANLDPAQADAVRERLLQDLIILANTNPTVAANMDPALLNRALEIAKTDLNNLQKMKPSPEVNLMIEDAKANVLTIQGLINGVTGKSVDINVNYKTQVVGPAPIAGGPEQLQNAFMANGGIIQGWVQKFANGGITRPVHRYANGGFENHVAQIQRAGGPVRIWAEPETKAEAYIPYAQAKRPRSLSILAQVAKDFGYTLTKAQQFADGGFAGTAGTSPTSTTNANVSIGTLYTVDADEAVRKIRNSQQDALAVAGITLTGA